MQETQEMWFPSLGQEDPLEKEMATHSSILACEIPWTEEPGRLQSMGSQRVRHDWTAHTCMLKYLRVQCHDVWMMYSMVHATPWIAAHQASLPPKSLTVCSNSYPLSWWCYLTISSSAALFSFCLLSFPASGSFPMSHLFTSCSQSIGASASARVGPGNIQGWFSLGLTALMSLQSKGLSRVSSSTPIQ